MEDEEYKSYGMPRLKRMGVRVNEKMANIWRITKISEMKISKQITIQKKFIRVSNSVLTSLKINGYLNVLNLIKDGLLTFGIDPVVLRY